MFGVLVLVLCRHGIAILSFSGGRKLFNARKPRAAVFSRAGAATVAANPPLPFPLRCSPNDLHVHQKQQSSQSGHQQSKLLCRQAVSAWMFV